MSISDEKSWSSQMSTSSSSSSAPGRYSPPSEDSASESEGGVRSANGCRQDGHVPCYTRKVEAISVQAPSRAGRGGPGHGEPAVWKVGEEGRPGGLLTQLEIHSIRLCKLQSDMVN